MEGYILQWMDKAYMKDDDEMIQYKYSINKYTELEHSTLYCKRREQ